MSYALESSVGGKHWPGLCEQSSNSLGWRSLLVETFQQGHSFEEFETTPTPDATVVLALRGNFAVEAYDSALWRMACYRPGLGCFTSPLSSKRLRNQAPRLNGLNHVMRISIPDQHWLAAQDLWAAKAGGVKPSIHDLAVVADPVVSSVARSLLDSMLAGDTDLYADACAHFLAAHLVRRFLQPSETARKSGSTDAINDKRLKRAMEMMNSDLRQQFSINELAREANISPFHFARSFKAKTGLTPHQYLRRIRMEGARRLLAQTDHAISQIAEACGYNHDGHFAAAFRKQIGVAPGEYRRHSLKRRSGLDQQKKESRSN